MLSMPFMQLWKRRGMDLGLLLEGISNASSTEGKLSAVLRDVRAPSLTVCEIVA